MGDIGDDRGVAVFSEALHDADIQVRYVGVKNLGKIGSESAREVLNNLKASDPSELGQSALVAMAMAKDPTVLTLAEDALKSELWTDR